MKCIFGLMLILAGIILGLWVGVYWGFVGGVIQIIEGAKHTPVEAKEIALGLARLWFAGLFGLLAAILPIAVGKALFED
jgi:hypothetical protein